MNTIKKLQLGTLALILGLALTACGGEETAAGSTSTPEAPAAPQYMSLGDVETMYNDAEAGIDGEEITIEGISWGVSGRTDGLQSLSMGTEKLEGFKQAPITCLFAGEADLSSAAQDNKVVVKGKIERAGGFGGFSVELVDCTLVE